MATTGADILKYLNQKIGHAYTGYLDIFKANRLIKDATAQAIEDKYRTLSKQKNYDEIRNFIAANWTFILAGDAVYLGSGGVTDYLHLLAVKVYFEQPLFLSFTSQNTTPLLLVFTKRNNLRTGEQVTIAGVTGNTNANGTFFIKRLNDYKYVLYADQNFQTPIVGNGTGTNGTIARVFFNYAKPYVSDAKIGVLNVPTVEDPAYETANGKLILHPTGGKYILMDYIKIFTDIDTANTTFDYETLYPYKFIQYIINKSVVLFAEQERDTELYQEGNAQLMQNV